MTVYAIQRTFGGGEEEVTVPIVPSSVGRLYEVESGAGWFRHHRGWWRQIGQKNPADFTLAELLAGGPVTDNPAEVTAPLRGCPACGPSGCVGHARTAETVLAPLGGAL